MTSTITTTNASGLATGQAFQELLERFQDSVSFDSDRTEYAYMANLRRFFRWIDESGRGSHPLDESDIVSYKKSLAEKATLTQCAYITAVRRFFAWTEKRGFYRNIAEGVTVKKDQQDGPIKQHLTGDKSAQLLEYFRETGNKRDYAMILLMLHSGLRTVEVSRLRVSDIGIEGGYPCVKVWGKGRAKDRKETTPTTWEAYAAIQDYLSEGAHHPEDFVFRNTDHAGKESEECGLTPKSISRICRKGLDAIGLTNEACGRSFSAHSLRHTAAVDLLCSGAGLYDVQTVLRHRKSTTTEIYLRSLENEKKFNRAASCMLAAHSAR